MITSGILNPQILSLLARVRHTNSLVIADRGFPFWPMIETVDISLCDDLPTVAQVLAAVRTHCLFGQAFMAEEHLIARPSSSSTRALDGIPLTFEPHEAVFKKRIPAAIGLIRTGDTTPYANVVLVSA